MPNPRSSNDKSAVDPAAVEELSSRVRGGLIAPGDPAYETARQVNNAMIDLRPGLILRCADAADVKAGVDFARERGLHPAVRGGGHSVAGYGTRDGGLVLDLSPMKFVHVNPSTGRVRAGGGANWGDVDHATAPYGLAVPGGIVSTTGIGGLTLGGGSGHLTRKYGLTIDNLVSADLVTADGRFVTASEKENPDLFWAIRGGGGNFGVVTSFEFQGRPVREIFCGPVLFPMEKAGEVARFHRKFMAEAPEDLTAFFGVQLAPPAPFVPAELQGTPMAVIVACYVGPREKAEQVLKPIRTEVEPAVDALHWATMPPLNSAFDALAPAGMQQYWKAEFQNDLDDGTIEAFVKHGPKTPNAHSFAHSYAVDGAAGRVGKTDTAFSYRDARFSTIIVAMHPDPADNDERIKWVRDYWEDIRPHSAGGAYVNFMMEEGDDRIAATYGENYPRLQKIKAKYDPDNLFRRNHNITPKA